MSTLEFSRLVSSYSAAMKPFALKLTKDMDDAKDLIQETVYRALNSKDKYADGTNLKAWLYTIMKNIFINNYRRKSKRNTIFDASENQFLLHSEANADQNLGLSSSILADLQLQIASLSKDYRVPFEMHFQGFKYHEIAEQLSLPIGTIKSRIHFARKILKAAINADQARADRLGATGLN